MNLLHILYLICCVIAIWIFFYDRKRYNISFFWIIPILLTPMSIVVIDAAIRYKQAKSNIINKRYLKINLIISILFFTISLLTLFIPGIIVYYFVMDGYSEILIDKIPYIKAVLFLALWIVYGLYLVLYRKLL